MKVRRHPARVAAAADTEVVYRSGLLFEADLVADALKRADIPHFRREESSSGLDFAMPVAPTQEPGVLWSVVVPRGFLTRARRVISSLPVSKNLYPGVWGFHPRPEVKRFFKQYAALSLLVIVVGWIFSLSNFCGRH
jgi:hypothetical protein